MTRYGIVGMSAFLVDFCVFQVSLWGLSERQLWFSLHPEQIANALGMMLGFGYSFVLHRQWAFNSQGPALWQLAASIVLLVCNTLIGGWLISLFIRDFGLSASVAKLLLQALVVVWNYLIFHYLIFPRLHAK